jgi:hypothetical protein
LATKKLKQTYNSDKTEGATHKRHNHILGRIKHKQTTNNAIIAQAEKGKTLVIIYQQDYNEKVYNFINENSKQQTPKKPNKPGHENHMRNHTAVELYILQKPNKVPDAKKP